MDLRRYVRGTLWGAAWSFVVTCTAAVLWALLTAVGDPGGSQGAKGVFLVGVCCLGLTLTALLILLALIELSRSDSRPAEREAKPPEPDS